MPQPRRTRKPAAEPLPPYDYANNRFYPEPASPAHPDMSKMPAMKPMASHPQPSRSVSRPVSRKVSR